LGSSAPQIFGLSESSVFLDDWIVGVLESSVPQIIG
jgi:hypothetical protein